jgi:hypothetical protein
VAEAQLADYTITMKPFMDQWETAYRAVEKEPIDPGKLFYQTLANDFCEEVRSGLNTEEIWRMIAKGASFTANHERCSAGDTPASGDEEHKTTEEGGGTQGKGGRRYTLLEGISIPWKLGYAFSKKTPKWPQKCRTPKTNL